MQETIKWLKPGIKPESALSSGMLLYRTFSDLQFQAENDSIFFDRMHQKRDLIKPCLNSKSILSLSYENDYDYVDNLSETGLIQSDKTDNSTFLLNVSKGYSLTFSCSEHLCINVIKNGLAIKSALKEAVKIDKIIIGKVNHQFPNIFFTNII